MVAITTAGTNTLHPAQSVARTFVFVDSSGSLVECTRVRDVMMLIARFDSRRRCGQRGRRNRQWRGARTHLDRCSEAECRMRLVAGAILMLGHSVVSSVRRRMSLSESVRPWRNMMTKVFMAAGV
jgi:hypothetical protein